MNKPILRLILLFLWCGNPSVINATWLNFTSLNNRYHYLGIMAVGTACIGYSMKYLFFGCTRFGLTKHDRSEDEGRAFYEQVEPLEPSVQQESSSSSSYISIFCAGGLLGIAGIAVAGLWHASQHTPVQSVTELEPSPLVSGPVDDVDLSRYVKMPEDIPENFDDLVSLPYALQTIIKRVRNGEKPPQGMLFFGDPGVGKSHSSKAFAKECGAILFRIPGYEFTGQGIDFARRLFKLIARVKQEYADEKKAQPLFLVIDEAEVFSIRSKLGFAEIHLDIGGTVRALMDYTEQKDSGVTCILTTNHPELIDSALKRPGRIGEHIEFKNPDKKERYAILQLHAQKCGVSLTRKSLDIIVAQSEGWTGDYLAQCVRRCQRNSSSSSISPKTAKQIACEVGAQWAASQEEREKVRSPLKSLVKSSIAALGSYVSGIPTSILTSGSDIVFGE